MSLCDRIPIPVNAYPKEEEEEEVGATWCLIIIIIVKSKSSLTWQHARFHPRTVRAQRRNFHYKAATFANFPPLSE